jgi:hypothetical protein
MRDPAKHFSLLIVGNSNKLLMEAAVEHLRAN